MITAIVLAAGQGSRMGTEIPKQFLDFQGAPLLVHALRAFENSPLIDDILLVASEAYLNYAVRKSWTSTAYKRSEP
jgi:2-C-methyl-D-erythritol 4-phosphate cytidylyltransferase